MLTGLSTLMPVAQADSRTASPSVTQQSHSGPPRVPLPVIDGNDIRFSRLSTAQGLSQTRVPQIVEDNQGFMWFGTQYGLDRYDGYEYKVFANDPARENSLSCVFVHSLFKDRSGALWVGCDHFLDKFDSITETFTHYQIEPAAPNEVVNAVDQISQDRAGMLWLATGKGLFELNPDTGKIVHYSHDSSNSFSLGNNEVKCTLEDSSGQFWVVDGDDLEEFDRNSAKVVLRIRLDMGIRYPSLYEDRLGVLWVTYVSSGKASGLAVLDRSTNHLIRYPLYDKKSGQGIYNGIMATLEDQNKTLWFASFGAGLLKFDREHQVFIRYRNDPKDLESLAEDRVISLCEDHEGNIWAGLHAREPNFFRTEIAPFTRLPRNQSNPNSLGETFVNAIYEDHEGVLWTGTTGALNRIDRRSGQSISYLPPGRGLSNDIIAINEDASGVLWVGTWGGGLSRFDRKTGHYKTYLHEPGNPSSLSNNIVSRLLLDHGGTMWITTWDGLDRFDPEADSFVTYKQDKTNSEEQYFNITEDRTGSFWIGSYGAVNRFDPKTGQFTVYPYKVGDPKSLSGDESVNSVYLDHSGTAWAATYNGLNKFDQENATFTHYFEKDGLPTNNLSCILEDRSGMLWISTSRGLSRFDPVANKFTNYSTVDGLPGNDLTGWDACFKSRSGEMFFGGFNGGVAFFPDKVVDRREPLPLVLTDFRVAGHSVEVGRNSPLQKSITYAHDVTLSHNQNIFSLSFAALTYFNPDANRYRYKLDRLEHNWIEVGSDRRVATYTTLPAGTYTFHVQSATRQGAWGEPGLALTINILPPWWATTWFRLFTGVFILAIVSLLYKLRLRKATAEITARLGERLQERERIARELHDTLLQDFQGIILRFHSISRRLVSGDSNRLAMDEGLSYADKVLREGRNRIRDIRADTKVPHDLSKAFAEYGNELSQLRPVSFDVKVVGTQTEIDPIVRDEIHRIGREAIGNAFKHSDCSKIEIELACDPREFQMRIRDDGKGIDPAILSARGKPGHWGMYNMRERAQKIGANLEFTSLPNASTTLTLKLPLGSFKRSLASLFLWRHKRISTDKSG